MAVVFVGIGSNLGDRRGNIRKAILCLRETEGICLKKVSGLITSRPVGCGGPDYLNGVLKLISELSPQSLLIRFQEIEKKIGRVSSFKNAPRIIDLDLLLYDNIQVNDVNLKIPHPEMFKREFVIRPLLKIAPELKNRVKQHVNSGKKI